MTKEQILDRLEEEWDITYASPRGGSGHRRLSALPLLAVAGGGLLGGGCSASWTRNPAPVPEVSSEDHARFEREMTAFRGAAVIAIAVVLGRWAAAYVVRLLDGPRKELPERELAAGEAEERKRAAPHRDPRPRGGEGGRALEGQDFKELHRVVRSGGGRSDKGSGRDRSTLGAGGRGLRGRDRPDPAQPRPVVAMPSPPGTGRRLDPRRARGSIRPGGARPRCERRAHRRRRQEWGGRLTRGGGRGDADRGRHRRRSHIQEDPHLRRPGRRSFPLRHGRRPHLMPFDAP